MKTFPESEILLYVFTNKNILDWALYNLPDLIKTAEYIHDRGKYVPEPGYVPSDTSEYKSCVESQIINLFRVEKIIKTINFEVDSLQENNLLVYWLKYRKNKPLRDIAKHLETTVYQVTKIEDNIRIQIYEGLNQEEITSSELFWFYEKFSKVA